MVSRRVLEGTRRLPGSEQGLNFPGKGREGKERVKLIQGFEGCSAAINSEEGGRGLTQDVAGSLIINFTFIRRGDSILCFTSHQGSESPGLEGA